MIPLAPSLTLGPDEYLIRDRSGTHTSVPLSLPRAPTAEVVPPRDLGTSGEA